MGDHRGSRLTGALSAQEKITRAWQLLAPTLEDDLRTIQSEVAQGVAHLIEWGDGEFFTVVRPESYATGNELVIVAAAGKNAPKHTAIIHELAKKQGFKSIRFHTLRPDAFLRMGKHLGYQRAHTILRADL